MATTDPSSPTPGTSRGSRPERPHSRAGGRAHEQERRVGLVVAVSLVVGNMVGSGVFLLPASLAPYGGMSFLGWALTTLGALTLALMLARLARRFPEMGGPYAYTRRGLGDLPGFLVAWGYWISIWTGNAAISVAFVGYLSTFVPTLATDPVPAAAAAMGAIWVLTFVNCVGVREAGRLQLATTVLKLLPLLAIGTLGLLYLEPNHFRPFNPSGEAPLDALTATATLTLWAFLGLESATIPADSLKDPARTMPRATVIGTLMAALIYILATAGVMGILPSGALASSPAPFAEAGERIWGPWAGSAIGLGAAVSAFGALNGWVLLQGQMPMAAARHGLFPRIFARTSRNGTPVPGLILSSGLATVLIALRYTESLVDQFTFIILLATLATLVPYTFSAISSLVLTFREGGGTLGSAGRAMAISMVALLYSCWAVVGSGSGTVFWGLILILAGVPVYWMMRRRGPGNPLQDGPLQADNAEGLVDLHMRT